MNEYKIIDASREDAPLIAWGVMEAVGDEIVGNMAKGRTREDVNKVFSILAAREDSQYSYQNTRIALTPDGEKAGICVSYNGCDLKRLRRSFFEEARKILGWKISEKEVDSLPGETSGEEYYLDSLAIIPSHRGKGIGKLLIADANDKAKKANLPLGLLVADDNTNARKLYESQGFKPVGRRPFAGEMMTNMRLLSV